VFFAALLLLVFSNSPYVKMFDSVPWPVRFGILAGFLFSCFGPGGEIAATTQQAALPPRLMWPTISFLARCAASTASRSRQSK
jgi:hypothetical protein